MSPKSDIHFCVFVFQNNIHFFHYFICFGVYFYGVLNVFDDSYHIAKRVEFEVWNLSQEYKIEVIHVINVFVWKFFNLCFVCDNQLIFVVGFIIVRPILYQGICYAVNFFFLYQIIVLQSELVKESDLNSGSEIHKNYRKNMSLIA